MGSETSKEPVKEVTSATRPQFTAPVYKSANIAALIILAALIALVYLNSVTGLVDISFVSKDAAGSAPRLAVDRLITRAIGSGPVANHVVNIIVHFMTAFMVFLLTFRILTVRLFTGAYRDSANKVALLCALIFAVHPAALFSVTHIANRPALLSSLFYFTAAAAFVAYRAAHNEDEEKRSLVICVVSAVLAVICSESAITLLPLLFVLDAVFFENPPPILWKKLAFFAIATAVIAGFFIIFSRELYGEPFIALIKGVGQNTDYGVIARLLTQSRVALIYLSIVLFPMPGRLSVEYDIIASSSVAAPAPIIAMAVIIGLLITAFIRRKKNPLVSCMILWYFITLLSGAAFLPLEPAYLHRLYVPAFAPFFALAYFAAAGHTKAKSMGSGGAPYGRLAVMLITAVTLLLSVVTVKQNAAFRDKLTVWRDAYKTAPEKEIVLYSLATAHLEDGQIKRAEEIYKTTLEKYGDHLLANYGIANVYSAMNRYALAEKHYKQAVAIDDEFAPAHEKLSWMYMRVKRYDLAIAELERVIELSPGSYLTINDLGNMYYNRGDQKTALKFYLKAAEIAPDVPQLHYNAARMYDALQDYRNALKEYETVLELDYNFEYKEEVEQKIKELVQKY